MGLGYIESINSKDEEDEIMKVTYIGHSGFFIEWESCCWLFDYYQGEIPEVDPDKKIFVFASHKHEDHYNPEIFRLHDRYKDIEFVLSSDIRLKGNLPGINNTEEIAGKILSVKPLAEYELYDKQQERILLKTLKSTDCGVAFLLKYQGKTVYHAGDLNMWVWKGSSKQEQNNMIALYNREMDKLRDIPIDVAFVPLDTRLEEYYYKGLEGFLNCAKAGYVFPMHFCGEPTVIVRFKQERAASIRETRIMDIDRNGQKWELDI
jgi:L-ascorbate metabolism protein UlaG (beta-lactamase superfamily)